jgi:tetratricopeptide (TPR) repeat protein
MNRMAQRIRADLEAITARDGSLPPERVSCARAIAAWVEGNDAEARRRLSGIRSDFPACLDAIEALARIEAAAGRAAEAAQLWGIGAALDRGYHPFLESLIEALRRARNLNAALHLVNEAITADPGRLSYRLTRGLVYLDLATRDPNPAPHGQLAIANFDEVLRSNPREARALMGRGAARAHVAAHDADDAGFRAALADLDAALLADPDLTDAWRRRAEARLLWADRAGGRRFVESARDDFSELLRRDPSDSSAWEARARVHERLQQWSAARADHEQALRLDPSRAPELRPRIDACRQKEGE